MSETTTVTVQPEAASKAEQEPRRAIRAEHDRNLGYYLEHADELDARYPKQFLLIHKRGRGCWPLPISRSFMSSVMGLSAM